MSSRVEHAPAKAPRQRLSREERQRQLLDVAWRLVREEGTEALSLGRLAEHAGVTKPLVYGHFDTRAGLLVALYRDFDARQIALMDVAFAASGDTLAARAKVIASSYVDCVMSEGREIPGVMAALAGSPELAAIKRDCQVIFIDKCRKLLAPFGKAPSKAAFWGMLGAADALSEAAVVGDISAAHAKRELFETVVAMVERSQRDSNHL